MRNMSFMLTTEQIRNRTKTVTRLAVLRVMSVTREPLCAILDQGIAAALGEERQEARP